MNILSHVHVGLLAEKDAYAYLEKQGLTLIEQNFRVKGGEIDLIMQDREYLVFIEVKMRSAKLYGSAIEVILNSKRARIIHAAKLYLLQRHEYYRTFCRFDVVGISPHPTIPNEQDITWIRDAFRVE